MWYRCLFAVAACCAMAARMNAQALETGTDQRVELLSIIFRLAGSPEYSHGAIASYEAAIDAHFKQFREHEAVRLARELRRTDGVSYDAAMSLAVHVTNIETLAERVPLDQPGILLDKRWHGGEARRFLEAARRFVAETRFLEFVQLQKPLYETAGRRMKGFAESALDQAWFGKFFGARAAARFIVVPGLVNGNSNYGTKFRGADGGEEMYAILGVQSVDSAGAPVFGPMMTDVLVHEFVHSYANPLIDSHSRELDAAATRIFGPVAEAMRAQAYGVPRVVLYESLVRGCVARYILAHGGDIAARRAIQADTMDSFFWAQELYDLLGEYERDRAAYPTLEAFMPKLTEYFKGLGPRVPALIKSDVEGRPKVVALTPANGANNVDPGLKQIVIRFDRAMIRQGFSITYTARRELYPKISNLHFDETATIFSMEAQLEAGREYEFGLNWPGGGSFLSVERVPLQYMVVHFRTASAARQ